jgi:purine-binding chemotaxis protein CheW
VEIREEQSDDLLVTTFQLGEAAFGVEAKLVQEIVKTGDITPVHHAPEGITGIRNLRGRIVTVVDLATALELGCVSQTAESRLLIIEWQGETVGFLVDAVSEAVAIHRRQIQPSPTSLSEAQRRRLRGIWREGNRLVAILDPKAVFSWEEAPEMSRIA